jgi:hypothetical protein
MRVICPAVSGEKFSPTENAGYSAMVRSDWSLQSSFTENLYFGKNKRMYVDKLFGRLILPIDRHWPSHIPTYSISWWFQANESRDMFLSIVPRSRKSISRDENGEMCTHLVRLQNNAFILFTESCWFCVLITTVIILVKYQAGLSGVKIFTIFVAVQFPWYIRFTVTAWEFLHIHDQGHE